MTTHREPSGPRAPELCPEPAAGSGITLPRHLDRPRLNSVEASEYLDLVWGVRVQPSTLSKFRCVGGGPPYQKWSRFPLYAKTDLDQWASARLTRVVASTSEFK